MDQFPIFWKTCILISNVFIKVSLSLLSISCSDPVSEPTTVNYCIFCQLFDSSLLPDWFYFFFSFLSPSSHPFYFFLIFFLFGCQLLWNFIQVCWYLNQRNLLCLSHTGQSTRSLFSRGLWSEKLLRNLTGNSDWQEGPWWGERHYFFWEVTLHDCCTKMLALKDKVRVEVGPHGRWRNTWRNKEHWSLIKKLYGNLLLQRLLCELICNYPATAGNTLAWHHRTTRSPM